MNRRSDLPDYTRRRVLRYGVNALGMIAAGKLLAGCRGQNVVDSPLRNAPVTLHESAVPGLLLPEGFTARVIARSGEAVIAGQAFRWHGAPDGGATFATDDGGWIYVSNSELDDGRGGVGAIRFAANGDITDAYSILEGTQRNCAGGPTPWNTWLSCEEVELGQVWECDPSGRNAARALPALGRFMHEAAAVDPATLQIYMTEDLADGRFYRYTPASVIGGIPDLDNGVLEAAQVDGLTEGSVSWHRIEDPAAAVLPTRLQAPETRPFAGGEGAWYADGIVYFTTKRDNRVWMYDVREERIALLYDDNFFSDPQLRGVDNITLSQAGTVYVAEDGDNMQIVAIDTQQRVFPVLQLSGHEGSEITGPAFDPSGTRLYFSSQRGSGGRADDGVTYEVTGPFQ